jgi:hypothetical protein
VARLRALGAAVLLAALLSAVLGCEDEPEPDIADPTPSATAPSPSETESSPTTSPTPEALTPEETVRAWVDAWNAALQSGDLSSLKELEADNCRNCSNLSNVIKEVFAAGGSFSGGEWSIDKAVTVEESARRVKMTVGMSVAAGSTVNAAGEDPVTYEAEKRLVVFELTAASGAWQIDVIELRS